MRDSISESGRFERVVIMSQQSKRRKKAAFLFLIMALPALIPLVVHLASAGKMQMYRDGKAMKQEVLKRIPPGSDIQIATSIMQENGFSCSFRRKGMADIHGQKEKSDILYCHKIGANIFDSTSWTIGMPYKNAKVSAVTVAVSVPRFNLDF